MVITTQNALEQLGVQWGGAVVGKTADGNGPAVVGSGFATNRSPRHHGNRRDERPL